MCVCVVAERVCISPNNSVCGCCAALFLLTRGQLRAPQVQVVGS